MVLRHVFIFFHFWYCFFLLNHSYSIVVCQELHVTVVKFYSLSIFALPGRHLGQGQDLGHGQGAHLGAGGRSTSPASVVEMTAMKGQGWCRAQPSPLASWPAASLIVRTQSPIRHGRSICCILCPRPSLIVRTQSPIRHGRSICCILCPRPSLIVRTQSPIRHGRSIW